ncbi:hypothetical protein [Streptomyces acidiscabies]|uniref:Uncharacterized protein n=1 Tax=Streptomyces acidiscabies TaxID=42234 RepID=A0ABU4MCY2_9ACTN|nr:hypothetical protein [Streptomyces acidiscabies]MDX3025651.1 hypothetical protein [Streptomyces acidiscabies]
MTVIAYTARYITQEQLERAYRRLGHVSSAPAWSTSLLIDENLRMSWACRVLHPRDPVLEEEYGRRGGHAWHVIAGAGELDWPPLRPEAEIWPVLLEREPVPSGPLAERRAVMLGKSSVEEMHRDQLRAHYLGNAHTRGGKRNPTDINFDPVVRDWTVTARALAAFVDAHRPPLLTAEQRVMEQGVRVAELEAELASATQGLHRLMRNAAREQDGVLRRGFKQDMSRWGGVSRPTVNSILSAAGGCEGAVPDEDGGIHPWPHSHSAADVPEHTGTEDMSPTGAQEQAP